MLECLRIALNIAKITLSFGENLIVLAIFSLLVQINSAVHAMNDFAAEDLFNLKRKIHLPRTVLSCLFWLFGWITKQKAKYGAFLFRLNYFSNERCKRKKSKRNDMKWKRNVNMWTWFAIENSIYEE